MSYLLELARVTGRRPLCFPPPLVDLRGQQTLYLDGRQNRSEWRGGREMVRIIIDGMPADGSVASCIARIRPNLFQRVSGIHRKGGGGGESLRQGRDSRMEAGEGERKDEVTGRTRRSRGWRGRKKTRVNADWICPRARAVELRSPIPVLWTRAVELVLGT